MSIPLFERNLSHPHTASTWVSIGGDPAHSKWSKTPRRRLHLLHLLSHLLAHLHPGGDFAAVGRGVAALRRRLVARAAEEIREGEVDVEVVAELLVDAVLARAFRGGEKSLYSELWVLDDGRATVESIRSDKMAESQPDGNVTLTDIVVDERPRDKCEDYRPLFTLVQPHLFTRPTFLALLDVFEVFHSRGPSRKDYTPLERQKIEKLLDVVELMPVMRRARTEAEKYEASLRSDVQWREQLWHIWFQRHPSSPRCGFEHVFIGEATEDLNGRELVGGLHNWVKFYLEEQRGAARYLGPRYKGIGKEEAALNPYFVSGKFTWDLNGKHLIKDDFQSRDIGYVRYKLCIRRNTFGNLTTFFAAQLGTWDAHARAQLDQPMSRELLEERLQPLLVLHGFADDAALLTLAARVAAAGAENLRDALRHLHSEIRFRFEEEDLPDEMPLVVAELLQLLDEDRLGSLTWDELKEHFARTGLKGKKLLLPVRLALTGRQRGHSLSELLPLFGLMELGAPWSSEILPLRQRLGVWRSWLEREARTPSTSTSSTWTWPAKVLDATKKEVEVEEYLKRDSFLSDQVEKRLRQVERMQAAIQHWKQKIAQNRQECEDRNQQLRTEKDHIAKHFQELKAKMNHFRSEGKKRLADLTMNARNCMKSLNDQLGLAERILKTAELCRKFETEREKVLPFYLSRDILQEFEEGELEFGDEDLKEEIRKELTDVGIDEWTYLDNFFKRFNKVKLDLHAVEQEGKRLTKENVQLRSILKQFLDGVSVNEDVLSAPNPLLVVNGKVNLNHVPVKRMADKTVYVEAAHHAANTVVRH
ncbi:Dynein regulatory complex subunit 2 (Coiled-coil domain-containing protein 65 homolog) (Flagellar-associated protein 250) [Durusdinium trenchii]|uniref:Dynein regulatory complex subunit 2 (Coiled-coil domain-containing protein 65 homolog) (Flagellar-associated protein 250) n=1 Tax=Durusdinium trenchii TaxID=1381693 RepID=A0ABP0NBY4_9DINO